MPFKHLPARNCDTGVFRRHLRQFVHQCLADMHIVGAAEPILQMLEALREFRDGRRGLKAREQFGGIAQLFERDAEPMPF